MRCAPATSAGASSPWRPSTNACWSRWPTSPTKASSRSFCRCVADGLLDPDALREALTVPTLLVSVMAVNNEIGVVQDIPALAAIAKQAGALFHTDIGAGDRQDPTGPDRLEGRPGLGQRPQALRAEGRGRALCPPPSARAADAAVLRRRAGTRTALGHPARAADRRPWRGLPSGAGRNGRGGEAARGAARATAGAPARRRSRASRSTAACRRAFPATST